MKILVAGSRSLEPKKYYNVVSDMINELGLGEPIEHVTGCARGIDQIPYAMKAKQDTLKEFPADWDTHGKKAGMIRNAEMAEYCDAAIIIWDGESRGTKNMIANMNRVNKPYILYKV